MTYKSRVTSMMESFNGPQDLAGPVHTSPLTERAAAGEFRSAGTVPLYGFEAYYFTDGKQFFWLYGNRRNHKVSRADGEGPKFVVSAGNALERDNIEKAAKGAKLYKSLRDVETVAADTLKAMAMGEEVSVDEGRTDYTKMDFSRIHKGVKHDLHKEIIDHVLNDPKTVQAVEDNGLDLKDEATLRNLVTNILTQINVKRRGSSYRISLSMTLGGSGKVSFKKDMPAGEYEALLEGTTPVVSDEELSEAGIQKSSWPEFIKHAQLGLAYLGSKFDFSVEAMVDAIKRNRIDPKKLFVDRKLAGGTSRLRMTKLDKNGKESGVSNLDKVGKVFRFGDFFIVHNEKDGNSVVAYGIPASVSEELDEARIPTVRSMGDWILTKRTGSGHLISSKTVVGVRKDSTNPPSDKVMGKLGADSAMRFGVLYKEFKDFKGFDDFMKQLKIGPNLDLSEKGFEDYPVDGTTEDLAIDIQKAVEAHVNDGPLKSYASSVSGRMAAVLQALSNRDLAMGEFMSSVDKLLDKAKK